jgi:hypothetical protein
MKVKTPNRYRNKSLNQKRWLNISIRVVLSLILMCASILALSRIGNAEAAVLETATHTCDAFQQVNDNAFGLGSGENGSYSGEEGFEVLAASGHLYLGMEADNDLGARIWRTMDGTAIASSQTDWEEVAADEFGKPFGIDEVAQSDHIDSLAEFNGFIFASTANGGSNRLGTRIFRSTTGSPDSWEDAIVDYGAGFGTINNTNFKDMQVFDGYLCGGTQNWLTGAQVWCTSDGATWEQKNIGGFGSKRANSSNVEVWSGQVYDHGLYFGVENAGADLYHQDDDIAELFRLVDWQDAPNWENVFTGPKGSHRTDILGDLDGYIYISIRSEEGILIFRSPNGDQGTWVQANEAGMNGNPNNDGTIVDGAVVYNGALYVAVSNKATGFELWRTKGKVVSQDGLVDWEKVGSSGLGDSHNIYAELVTFNGYLYVWTSNYVTGQQVLKTECGIEETIPVSAAGVDYSFSDPVGAQVNFSDLGDVTQVTVRTYPGAWDQEGLSVAGVTPVKRHYVLSTDGVNYTADITLTYTQSEFDESTIYDESVTYQALWDGSEWVTCPPEAQLSDPVENKVACSQVTSFSRMAIAGDTAPSSDDGANPTPEPTQDPTTEPTQDPTTEPTQDPTPEPTVVEGVEPAINPGQGNDPSAVTLVDFRLRDGSKTVNGYWLAVSALLTVFGVGFGFFRRLRSGPVKMITKSRGGFNRNPPG